jgi:hypothetical protein
LVTITDVNESQHKRAPARSSTEILMSPIRLSDAELDAIFAAARPLAVECRDAFLQEVATLLNGCVEVGPGTVHRAIEQAQRRFWVPPQQETRRPPRWARGTPRFDKVSKRAW